MLKAVSMGCGWVAGGYDEKKIHGLVRTHAYAYQLCDGVELTAVVDSDINKAQRFAEKWGVEFCFSEVRNMLREVQPDIVSLCTPDESHAELLELCLYEPSIKAVWCEKPLATDYAVAKRLVEAYEKKQKLLLVNYQRGFSRGYKSLAEDLKSERFGGLQKIIVHYTKGIVHNGSHAVALLIEWLGLPDEMRTTTSIVDFSLQDPTVDAVLSFNGVPVYMMGFDEQAYTLFELHIYTRKAKLSLIQGASKMKIYQVMDTPAVTGHRYLGDARIEEMGLESAMLEELEVILHGVRTGSLVDSNARKALAALEICRNLADGGLAQ
jgi:predicted dehydrogenase